MKRIHKLQNTLKSKKLSAVIIAKPQNVRYLCNFVGTNGRLLVTPKKAVLITDFRYLRSARRQLPYEVEIFDQAEGIKKLLGSFKNLGVEEQFVTYAQFTGLKKTLPGVQLKPISGLIERMRIIKDSGEVNIKREACHIADACMDRLVKTIKRGVSEDELEWNLLKIARSLGASGFSFPPIICFGKNTADVHHIKEDNRLRKGEMVLIDMGIEYKGYMTDMTRTFFTKKPTAIEHKIYTTVLEANQKAIQAIEMGKKFSEIDRAARDHIKDAQYDKFFGHSTGHGVGMEVHEAPTVSSHSKDVVRPGMIFTIEPGIYLDHLGGARIEDEVYINENGQVEVLTHYPKDIVELKI